MDTQDDIKFICPSCGNKCACEDGHKNHASECPWCGKYIYIKEGPEGYIIPVLDRNHANSN